MYQRITVTDASSEDIIAKRLVINATMIGIHVLCLTVKSTITKDVSPVNLWRWINHVKGNFTRWIA